MKYALATVVYAESGEMKYAIAQLERMSSEELACFLKPGDEIKFPDRCETVQSVCLATVVYAESGELIVIEHE